MDKVDITVIGAGVIGLAVASELSKKYKDIVILEKNSRFGQETSSRNSEVIHSGVYYPKDSLKARLCIEGNNMLYEICNRNNISYAKLGKIILANNKNEKIELEMLMQNGKNNGVADLEMLSQEGIAKLEPNIKAISGIYSRSTGIVDSHKLMEYFLNNSISNGAIIAYNSEVFGINKDSKGYKVKICPDKPYTFETKILINAAGLYSDKIACLAGIDIDMSEYRLHYCKGNYFRLKGKAPVNRLIYPAPELQAGGLGIHLTPDLHESIRLGPDAKYIDKIEYSVDESEKENFYNCVKRFLPSLNIKNIYPDTAGIRPKLQPSGGNFKDFVLKEETEKGFTGLINLIGIESPGLTASPSIAKYVGKIVGSLI